MTQRIIHQYKYPYHLTFNTHNGNPLFENQKPALLLYYVIHAAGGLKGFKPIAFSILPTHVHLLVLKDQRALEKAHCGGVNGARHGQKYLTPQRGLSSPRAPGTIHDEHTISHLVQSIKGTFSRKLQNGRIWQPRYNYRIITTESQLNNTLSYIINNYKKHGLPRLYGRYPYYYLNHQAMVNPF